jgi:hypothetical protein
LSKTYTVMPFLAVSTVAAFAAGDMTKAPASSNALRPETFFSLRDSSVR